jgi:hypothetical protein
MVFTTSLPPMYRRPLRERWPEFRQLDTQIEDVAHYEGVPYQLARGCLHSALLARGWGRAF